MRASRPAKSMNPTCDGSRELLPKMTIVPPCATFADAAVSDAPPSDSRTRSNAASAASAVACTTSIGAEGPHRTRPLGAGDRGDRRAADLRELHGEAPDAAGRTRHEDTRAQQRGSCAQDVGCRRARHRQRGGLDVAHLVGQDRHPDGGHPDVLRPSVPLRQPDDARALGRPAAVGRAARDDPRDVLAGDPPVAQRDEGQLTAVDREGADLHQRLVRRRLGLRGVVAQLRAPRAVGCGEDGAHSPHGIHRQAAPPRRASAGGRACRSPSRRGPSGRSRPTPGDSPSGATTQIPPPPEHQTLPSSSHSIPSGLSLT